MKSMTVCVLSFNNSYHFFRCLKVYIPSFIQFSIPFPRKLKSVVLYFLKFLERLQSWDSTEDILVSFRTGHFEKGTLVTDSRKIAWHYLQRWFLFDISVPWIQFGVWDLTKWLTNDHQTRDKDARYIVLLLFWGGGSAKLSLDASGYIHFILNILRSNLARVNV